MIRDMTYFAGEAAHSMAGVESVILRPGFMLQFAHVPPGGGFKAGFVVHESPIIFGFMLAGQNSCRYEDGALRNTQRVHGSGSNRITYLPDTRGTLECRGGMHRLGIVVSQEFLGPYLSLGRGGIHKELAAALAGKKQAFQWTGRADIRKVQCVANIFSDSYSGPLRYLHLETRALELIDLQLSEYLGTAGCPDFPTLGPQDVRRIKEARELLLRDLENPPSLAHLARIAGINEKKLKSGFKQVFGVPVFEYFRNYRLDLARELLASGAMNVTETGMHIGYRNLSHFSAEFKKRFGMTPKKIQK